MSRIYLPATRPSDWQRLLAQPEKHWKTGYSARALAHCWHAAARFPPEVEVAFAASGHPALRELEPLVMLPEHKVPLPGRGPASQNDLWVLARNDAGLVSIAVEGKVNEPFDQPLSEWLSEASPEKRKRLAGLSALLGLTVQPPPTTPPEPTLDADAVPTLDRKQPGRMYGPTEEKIALVRQLLVEKQQGRHRNKPWSWACEQATLDLKTAQKHLASERTEWDALNARDQGRAGRRGKLKP